MSRVVIGLLLLVFSLNAEDIYATFNVLADKKANLAFSSSGIVEEVFVEIGSEVKRGEILAKLQNGDLRQSVEIAKANLRNAEVVLRFAKKDYSRQVKIKNMIEKTKFDKFALSLEIAKVALIQAKANLAYKKVILDKTSLKAPFDGVIYDKSVEIGDVVSGQMLRTILKIQSKTKRKLVLGFDQKYWKKVKVGQTFKYGVDGDKKVYEGKISKIYPFANSGNRKIKAEVEVEGFVVGLFGEGYIKEDK